MQLSGSRNKSIIWIYKWTCWTTRGQPGQLKQVVDCHRIVPKLTVWVYWRSGLQIWQWFSSNLDPDPKWQSGTVANTWPEHGVTEAILTWAVDMRSEGSLHIAFGQWRQRKSLTNYVMLEWVSLILIGIVLVSRWLNLWCKVTPIVVEH
jgi:hypothetical protein